MQDVSAAVINFQTPDLLRVAVRSFYEAYPDVRLLIVDNGSEDESRDVIEGLCQEAGDVLEALYLPENIYHGPAMHRALQTLTTPYAYLFDSDTKTKRGGFLEAMCGALEEPERRYGAGQVVEANKRGFADAKGGIPVLVSAHMLLRRDVYHRLPPFVHHGLPALRNFRAATEEGYTLVPFPIGEYVEHFGRGTAERYGYGLGLKSKLDYVLSKLGL